jgi:hypothetical protein
MSPPRGTELSVTLYATALVPKDERPLALVHALEQAIPGLRLEWTLSHEGELKPLPQRDTWLSQGRPDGPGFPLVCNGDGEDALVTLFGLGLPASQSPGRQPLLDVHADLPLNAVVIPTVMNVLEALGESSRAFWGHATPFDTTVEIARQVRDPVRKPGSPPRGLPALKLPEDLPAPEIPHRLGWLNYWSAGTARLLGFPDPSRDAELLSRARQTATGGWVVPLTDAPLTLDDPNHLEALLRAYERFPTIGGRAHAPP